MKKVMTVVALMMCTSMAQSSIFVNWSTSGGYAWSGALEDGLVPTGSGQSVLFQLLWTPSGTAGQADVNSAGYVSGDNILLTSVTVTEDGATGNYDHFFYGTTLDSEYDDQGDDYQTTYATDGYIFGRVFENSSPSSGDWYYQGAVTNAINADFGGAQPPTAQGYDMTQEGEASYLTVNQNFIDGTYGFQAVPEPGTIGLLALGLVTLGGAARKRRKTRA